MYIPLEAEQPRGVYFNPEHKSFTIRLIEFYFPEFSFNLVKSHVG